MPAGAPLRASAEGVYQIGEVQARSDAQQEVAILEGEICAACGQGSRPSDEQRILGRDDIRRAPRGFNWDLQQREQFPEFLFGAGQPDSVANEDQRAFALV